MQQRILALLVFCIVLVGVIIGYRVWPTPTPPPATATPTPATRQPTAPATVEQAPILTTDQIVLSPFILALEQPWAVLRPEDQAWNAKIQQLAAAKPLLTHYWAALAALSDSKTALALTWPPTATTDLWLVVAVTPAEELTLQGYLAAAAAELGQSRLLLGTAMMVNQATLRYDVRPDHIPVATIRYTLPDGAHKQAVTGYQTAMLDKTGTHLLLLTAVTHDPDPAKAVALVDALTAAVQEAK